MKIFFTLIVIFSSIFFFTFSTLLGYEYTGSESSASYSIYSISVFLIGTMLFIFDSISKNHIYRKKEFLLLSIPFIMTASYLLSVLNGNIIEIGTMRFIYFIIWSMPSILMGIYLSRDGRIEYIGKYIEILMWLFSFAIIISTIDTLIYGENFNIAGGTYQAGGYISAFVFGINLYFLAYGKNHARFSFATTMVYRFMCIVLLLLQLMGVFTSGARGAMVLVIVYFLYMTMSIVKKMEMKQLTRYTIAIIAIIIIIVSFLPNLLNITAFESSFNRLFSYISMNGIDWSGTSNRDLVYTNALNIILESPILGYGIFGMFKTYGTSPHNIFLEVIMQGGIVYLSVFILILINVFRKLYNITKVNPKCRIVTILLLYPLTHLMFSGSYINNSILWFSISFIFSYHLSTQKKV